MTIDIKGLVAVPMRKATPEWQGVRYYSPDGDLVCKTCTKCRALLVVDSFPRMRGQKDGLSTKCSPCGSAIGRTNYRKRVESKAKSAPQVEDVSGVLDPASGEILTLHKVTKTLMKKTTSSEWRGSTYHDEVGTLVAKTCPKCKNILVSDAFGPSRGRVGNLESYCRKCNSIRYYTQLMQREKDSPGFLKSRSDKRYLKLSTRSPEEVFADTMRLRPDGTKWCRKCRNYREAHKYNSNKYTSDGLSVMCRECHNQDSRDKYHQAAENTWTASGIPWTCYLSTCDKPYQEQDHVIPLELDGPDDLNNLLPMCTHHNRSKSDSSLAEWLRGRHPEALLDTLSTVISFGVTPWTYKDSEETIEGIMTELVVK